MVQFVFFWILRDIYINKSLRFVLLFVFLLDKICVAAKNDSAAAKSSTPESGNNFVSRNATLSKLLDNQ